jgi:hypothetical protein
MPDVTMPKETKNAVNMFIGYCAPETPDHRSRLVGQAGDAGQRNLQ